MWGKALPTWRKQWVVITILARPMSNHALSMPGTADVDAVVRSWVEQAVFIVGGPVDVVWSARC